MMDMLAEQRTESAAAGQSVALPLLSSRVMAPSVSALAALSALLTLCTAGVRPGPLTLTGRHVYGESRRRPQPWLLASSADGVRRPRGALTAVRAADRLQGSHTAVRAADRLQGSLTGRPASAAACPPSMGQTVQTVRDPVQHGYHQRRDRPALATSEWTPASPARQSAAPPEQESPADGAPGARGGPAMAARRDLPIGAAGGTRTAASSPERSQAAAPTERPRQSGAQTLGVGRRWPAGAVVSRRRRKSPAAGWKRRLPPRGWSRLGRWLRRRGLRPPRRWLRRRHGIGAQLVLATRAAQAIQRRAGQRTAPVAAARPVTAAGAGRVRAPRRLPLGGRPWYGNRTGGDAPVPAARLHPSLDTAHQLGILTATARAGLRQPPVRRHAPIAASRQTRLQPVGASVRPTAYRRRLNDILHKVRTAPGHQGTATHQPAGNEGIPMMTPTNAITRLYDATQANAAPARISQTGNKNPFL